MVELASTVSVRNVSSRYPIVLEFAGYYDSTGKRIRDYISTPSELPALATIEFVVQQADTAGGPGANFLIRWTGPADVDEPLMEAVMLGRSGTQGFLYQPWTDGQKRSRRNRSLFRPDGKDGPFEKPLG